MATPRDFILVAVDYRNAVHELVEATKSVDQAASTYALMGSRLEKAREREQRLHEELKAAATY